MIMCTNRSIASLNRETEMDEVWEGEVASSSSIANWLLKLGGLTLASSANGKSSLSYLSAVSPVAQNKQCEHILENYKGIIIIFKNILSKSTLCFSSHLETSLISIYLELLYHLGHSLNNRLSE